MSHASSDPCHGQSGDNGQPPTMSSLNLDNTRTTAGELDESYEPWNPKHRYGNYGMEGMAMMDSATGEPAGYTAGRSDEKDQLDTSESECPSLTQNGPPSSTDSTQSDPAEWVQEDADADENDMDRSWEMFRPYRPRKERRKPSRESVSEKECFEQEKEVDIN